MVNPRRVATALGAAVVLGAFLTTLLWTPIRVTGQEGKDPPVVKPDSGQPWSAYNWYRGKAQSLVEFNTDVPISMLNILGTMAHEGYPGHHTEGQLK